MSNKTGQSRQISVLSPSGGVRRGAAFTLVELIVVLLIIGLLMAVIVPATNYAIVRALAAQAQTQVESLANAAEAYELEKGHYPAQLNTADLSTYTGSQMLAACVFDYPYTDIGGTPSPTSEYCPYDEDESLDTLENEEHTLTDGFWITPMAICYYVSWPGEAPANQFKESDNNEYTDGYKAAGADFATFITNPNYGLPYNDEEFLLISAGADREFFSDDDITNFEK